MSLYMDESAKGIRLTLKLSRIGSIGMIATPAPVDTEAAMELYSSASIIVFGSNSAFLNSFSS